MNDEVFMKIKKNFDDLGIKKGPHSGPLNKPWNTYGLELVAQTDLRIGLFNSFCE